MEDAHIAELDLGGGVSFFGVYDGHGGKKAAAHGRKWLLTCDQAGPSPHILDFISRCN